MERVIAVTDEETTGLDERVHEIIEIGVVLLEPKTLETLDELELKIKPLRIELASPRALEINGYTPEKWVGALSKEDAMLRILPFVQGGQFAAWNAHFDRRFLKALERETGVSLDDALDYHDLNITTVAQTVFRNDARLEKLKLDNVAELLGLGREPEPHRALTGARLAADVLRRLWLE